MARPASLMKQTRPRHSQANKDEALALAERIGVREQSLADENVRLKRLLAEQAPVIAT